MHGDPFDLSSLGLAKRCNRIKNKRQCKIDPTDLREIGLLDVRSEMESLVYRRMKLNILAETLHLIKMRFQSAQCRRQSDFYAILHDDGVRFSLLCGWKWSGFNVIFYPDTDRPIVVEASRIKEFRQIKSAK